jgi:WD40 repeat protein
MQQTFYPPNFACLMQLCFASSSLDNQNISMHIFVWSMKTSRLLDVLSGHEGPVHGLMFLPINV